MRCITYGSGADAFGACSPLCTTDAECSSSSLSCGISAAGERVCVLACPAMGYACVDGISTSCERIDDEAQCLACGCPGDRPRCVGGEGCFARSDVGGPCTWDGDCRTNHCSEISRTCQVAVGQPCTSDDCDLCRVDVSGWTYCTRECGAPSDSRCNGDLCIAFESQPTYRTCYARCSAEGTDPTCPGTCHAYGASFYCDCDMPECRTVVAERSIGERCTSDGACETDLCLHEHLGVCSRTCTQASDCPSGTVCALLPCAEGQTHGCGDLCLPSCEATACTCGPAYTPVGDVVDVCDPRYADGHSCVDSFDCLSGRCADRECVPTSGLPNGSACAAPEECVSMQCISAHCRGTALLGDACTVDEDCAAGECCGERCEPFCP